LQLGPALLLRDRDFFIFLSAFARFRFGMAGPIVLRSDYQFNHPSIWYARSLSFPDIGVDGGFFFALAAAPGFC
jgi:hypothetical protein